MANINIMFNDWPFKKDEIATVYWITSPVKDIASGSVTCFVYFKSETCSKPLPVKTQWGNVPALWIGRRFMNGAIIDATLPETTITIYVSDINEAKVVVAAEPESLPSGLYSLYRESKMCREYCEVFLLNGMRYIIPCIELARAFYMYDSMFANQLISDGGLEEWLVISSWRVQDRNLDFDFSSNYKGRLTKEFAAFFASIFGVAEMKAGWESTHVDFVKSGRIMTAIPLIQELVLNCCGITKGDATLITTICPPTNVSFIKAFGNINFGPESLTSDGLKEKSGLTYESESAPEEIDIGVPGISAKQGSGVTAHAGLLERTYLNFPNIKRKKSSSTSKKGVSKIELLSSGSAYTTDDRTGVGEYPFVDLEPELCSPPIDIDPDFPEFCEALNELPKKLDISSISVSYAKLPDGKTISRLRNTQPRKYAVANISTVGSGNWLIIEIYIQDGHSISTLLLRCDKDTKSMTEVTIGKFMTAGGHWVKSCFDSEVVKYLEHYKGRSPERWAYLMACKMYY